MLETKELRYEFYIGASPEAVWNALVSPEGTKAVFFNCVMKSTFEVGAPFEYVGPGGDGDETVHVYGSILACEPHKTLSLLEHPGPSYRENHAELTSRITYTLETVGSCTKLTIVNDEWTPQEHPSYANSKNSWWMILSSIKTFAEMGKTLDFGW